VCVVCACVCVCVCGCGVCVMCLGVWCGVCVCGCLWCVCVFVRLALCVDVWCVVCEGVWCVVCGVCGVWCVCVCVVCLCVCVFVCVGLTLPKLSLEASFKFDPPLQWGATARGVGLAVDINRLLLTSHGHLWGSEGGHRPGPPGNHNFCQQPRGWGLAVAKGVATAKGVALPLTKTCCF